MTANQLLLTCRQAGIALAVDGGFLDVDAPAGRLTPELKAALVASKPELLAVLSRLEAMQQIGVDSTGRGARPPLAVARADARGGPGRCFSCGDPLAHPEAYGRCDPCAAAADLFYAGLDDDGEAIKC